MRRGFGVGEGEAVAVEVEDEEGEEERGGTTTFRGARSPWKWCASWCRRRTEKTSEILYTRARGSVHGPSRR